MGCTSSAPNTISANANTADKSIQIEEDTKEKTSTEVAVADIEDENRTNEIKVLPSCDTFEDTVQLVRNNISTDSLVHEKGLSANGRVKENEDVVIDEQDNKQDEHTSIKATKIEMLVDKIFEINQHLNENNHQKNETENNLAGSNETTENKNEEEDKTISAESNDNEHGADVENVAEAIEEEVEEPSPSQSQSSRATRWEALADIAAELPPSLAVDPLTGQIYTLK